MTDRHDRHDRHDGHDRDGRDDPALDRDIRELLAHAVAAAPPAPDLDDLAHPSSDRAGRPDRRANRWIIGGGIGLVAAALTVGLVVLSDDTRDAIDDGSVATQPPASVATTPGSGPVDPSTPPSTAPTTEGGAPAFGTAPTTGRPDATVPPTTTTAPTTGATAAPTSAAAPTTVAPTTTPPTAPPPTADARPAGAAPPAAASLAPAGAPVAQLPPWLTGPIAAASPTGVDVRFADGVTAHVADGPARVALLLDGGDVLFQRATPDGAGAAVGGVLRWSGETGEITEQPLLNPTGGPITLHDATTVLGAPVVLYETGPVDCRAGIGCDGALVHQDLRSGEAAELDRMGTFEDGWSGLTLSSDGRVVGTRYAGAGSSLYGASFGPEPAPTAVDAGLEASYGDCDDCPTAYEIDRAGTTLSWSARLDDGSPVVVRRPIGAAAGYLRYAGGPTLPCRLDTNGASIDGEAGTGSGWIVVSACDGGSAAAIDVTSSSSGDAVDLPAGATYRTP